MQYAQIVIRMLCLLHLQIAYIYMIRLQELRFGISRKSVKHL